MATPFGRVDNDQMMSDLTLERVRRDVEVVSRAGLDTATFVAEFHASVSRAVPSDAACMATVDPATRLLTGTYKFGDLAGNDVHDQDWGLIEYGPRHDPTSFVDLVDRPDPACAVGLEVHGEIDRSLRMRELIEPCFGYTDELRMVGRQHTRGWGGVALFRGPDQRPFTEGEVSYLASLSADFAAGLRAGLLVRLGATTGEEITPGPRVVIVGSDDRVLQVSVGAEDVLRLLADAQNMASTAGMIGGLVAGARRYAVGQTQLLPRTRVRLSTGRWMVLHASPLSRAAGTTGDVVITMEEARPPEIIPLIVEAFDLTARERDVTQLVLLGIETKEIATRLHLSRYTVQDHLKSVFDKADVRSRRELVSRIYFDQYVPRLGADLVPSGWFSEL